MSNDLDLVILKTLVTNKKHALDFANECDIKLFSPEVFHFASLAVGYTRTYKDLPTQRVMVERLEKSKNEKLIETVKKMWAQLDATNYNDREYKHDLEKFKKRYAEKQITAMKEALAKQEPGSMDVLKTVGDMQKVVQTIKALSQVKAYERKTLKEAVPIFRDEYNAKMEDPHFDKGIKTGYSYLDNVTDGLRPSELLLIGGESGAGKSMLLMNMAIQIWMQENTIEMTTNFGPGHSVLYFSLEMPFKPCLNRVLARMSGNASKKIRGATLNNDEAVKLKKSLKFINNYPYQFEIVDIPRGATMESLELIFEEAKATYDPKVVVIDYMGLMNYEGAEMDDWLKLGKISEKIHEFARVHNLTVLSAVQLNRAKGGKESEDKIGLHRIGRSALIMQNANIAIQIETRPSEKDHPDMNYHLIKNRDGELGKGKMIKSLAAGTLIDDKVLEDKTEFPEVRDPDDISDRMALLDD
jgi:replicative DNA helicase